MANDWWWWLCHFDFMPKAKEKKKRKNINKKWNGESVNKSFKHPKEPKKTLEKVALNK